MKKIYEYPEVEVITLNEDVITTSGDSVLPGNNELPIVPMS